MKMIEISEEKFYDFANKSKYNNYCQTSNYGLTMKYKGYDYNFVAYTTNENEILAAGMFLTKKIGKTYYYAYCPKGFIIDYDDNELVRKFTRNLIKYYIRKKVIFLKINPEIKIATIDSNNDFEKNSNENTSILELLKSLGYKKRKELKPYELIEPKLTNIIDLKKFNLDNIDKETKEKIEISKNNGLEIIDANQTEIQYLYDIKNDELIESVDYYKKMFDEFKKNDKCNLFLVKIDFEKYLINSKKRVEEEQDINDELNQEIKKNNTDEVLDKKMDSDRRLEKFKQDIVYATKGLKDNVDVFIAGVLAIKHNNKITLVLSGKDDNYNYLYADYYLYNYIIEKFKEDYDYLDLYGIADNFEIDSKYYETNKFKTSFNSEITEYVGELDLVISKWRFNIVEKNNLLSNEFTKRKVD